MTHVDVSWTFPNLAKYMRSLVDKQYYEIWHWCECTTWTSVGERNKRYKRNKKRKGREKEERRAIMQQASWVLIMDEKEKAERETQSKKEQHLSKMFQRVLKENR